MSLQTDFIDCWTFDHGHPPACRWEICGTCEGDGSHAQHLGAYTQSDRAEMGGEWDEFADDVRAGRYDQRCGECAGTGKVKAFEGEALIEWREWQAEMAADAATRRAESGWYA